MDDIIIIAILIIIIGLAGFYVYKAKKSGKKCIGCPDGSSCQSKGNSGCGCGCDGCASSSKCNPSE